jgi:hypothetical protein
MPSKDKAVFENQNNFRVLNQIHVISELVKGPRSCQDLSKALGLSFTAISKIVDELCQSGLTFMLPSRPDPEGKPGRRPAYVSLNLNIGYIGAVDLSSREISVAIATMDGHIVRERKLEEAEIIDAATLESIVTLLKEELASPGSQRLAFARDLRFHARQIGSGRQLHFRQPHRGLRPCESQTLFRKTFSGRGFGLSRRSVGLRGGEGLW